MRRIYCDADICVREVSHRIVLALQNLYRVNIEFGLSKKSKKLDLVVLDNHKSLRLGGLSYQKVWVVTTSKTKVSGITRN